MSEIHELLGKVNQHLDDFNRAVEDERKVTPSSLKLLISDVVRGDTQIASELGKQGRSAKKKLDPVLEKKVKSILRTIDIVQEKKKSLSKNEKMGAILVNFWQVLEHFKKDLSKAVKTKPAKVERKTKPEKGS